MWTCEGIRSRLDRYGNKLSSKTVSLTLELGPRDNLGIPLHLVGGVTGYEGFYIKDESRLRELFSKGWFACAGTHGSWDRLFVTGESLSSIVYDVVAEWKRRLREL